MYIVPHVYLSLDQVHVLVNDFSGTCTWKHLYAWHIPLLDIHVYILIHCTGRHPHFGHQHCMTIDQICYVLYICAHCCINAVLISNSLYPIHGFLKIKIDKK